MGLVPKRPIYTTEIEELGINRIIAYISVSDTIHRHVEDKTMYDDIHNEQSPDGAFKNQNGSNKFVFDNLGV